MQAVLFEIQLVRSRSAASSGSRSAKPKGNSDTLKVKSDTLKPESSELAIEATRRGSQGIKSILLKGEMRYLKEINVLIFLCSPL